MFLNLEILGGRGGRELLEITGYGLYTGNPSKFVETAGLSRRKKNAQKPECHCDKE